MVIFHSYVSLPEGTHLAQIQDLLGLVSSRDSALLSTDLAQKTTMTVIHRYHKDMVSLPPTKMVNLGMITNSLLLFY